THPLTIAAHSYIHLRAHLDTTHAPLEIGENCIISEQTVVGISSSSSAREENSQEGNEDNNNNDDDGDEGVILEHHVVIEPKAVVEAGSRIGEGTVVDVGAKVGKGAVVGKYCKIGPLCSVAPDEVIPDHTILYGYNERRIDRSGMHEVRAKMVEQQVEVLKKADMASRKK
ncbi:MAG: hypothetical protein Q9216_006729, partial [Gyalolechia sp. 2 TL-2023]